MSASNKKTGIMNYTYVHMLLPRVALKPEQKKNKLKQK